MRATNQVTLAHPSDLRAIKCRVPRRPRGMELLNMHREIRCATMEPLLLPESPLNQARLVMPQVMRSRRVKNNKPPYCQSAIRSRGWGQKGRPVWPPFPVGLCSRHESACTCSGQVISRRPVSANFFSGTAAAHSTSCVGGWVYQAAGIL